MAALFLAVQVERVRPFDVIKKLIAIYAFFAIDIAAFESPNPQPWVLKLSRSSLSVLSA